MLNRNHKGTFIKNKRGGKHKCAFLLLLLYVFNLLNLFNISFAATPPISFYNDLIKIHGDNPNRPRWTYNEFVNRINEIANYTLSSVQNKHGDFINPYAYEEYYQVVVYGLPHGKTSDGTTPDDFFVTGNGRMFNIKNGKQGEYRFIGYNEKGDAVTNDSWFNPEYSGGGRFSTADDYRNLRYDVISGAEASWNRLDDNIKNYLLNTKFRDDDYVDGNSQPTPYSLSDIWSEDFIYKHALIQIEPGIQRAASIKLSYNGKYHNTITIDPIDFSFTGGMTTDKDTYTIPAGQNEVVVNVSMSATFAHSTANVYLKDVLFSCMGTSKSVSVTTGNVNYKAEGIKLTYSRNNLQTGINTIKIDGFIQVNSNYRTYAVASNIWLITHGTKLIKVGHFLRMNLENRVPVVSK